MGDFLLSAYVRPGQCPPASHDGAQSPLLEGEPYKNLVLLIYTLTRPMGNGSRLEQAVGPFLRCRRFHQFALSLKAEIDLCTLLVSTLSLHLLPRDTECVLRPSPLIFEQVEAEVENLNN